MNSRDSHASLQDKKNKHVHPGLRAGGRDAKYSMS